MSISGQRSANIFHTLGCSCVLLAEIVSAAAVSSPPAARPSPASQRAKSPPSPATPPYLRANQWVYLISNVVCLLPVTNALSYYFDFLCVEFWLGVVPGSFFRHGGGLPVSDACQASVVQRWQTDAPHQSEVKGERSQHRKVWENSRPQPHGPSHMSPLTDPSEYWWSPHNVTWIL